MSSILLRLLVSGTCLGWLLPSAMAQRSWTYPPVFEDAKEFTYRTIGDVELRAWVFQPDDISEGDTRPAVVFFFGGGWRSGTPAQFADQCRYLASRGCCGNHL